ncbi:MAG: leucine-rich repeat domain-containing protein [Clostridia bacterium]|nr:leucine-rich repeat domain-containing protein [Clostridia bacterium]
MKKIIGSVLCTVMLFAVCFSSAVFAADVTASGACGVDGSDVTWTYYSDGKITFTGTGTMKSYNNGSQPWYKYMTSITEAEFGEGLTRVPSLALYGAENMTSVTIGSTVTEIGSQAFRSCSKLAELNFTPATTCTIADYAFERDGFVTLALPEGITSVGPYAFNNMQGSLKQLYLPSTLQTIGEKAFRNAGKLESVSIPKEITNIPDDAFENDGFSSGYAVNFKVVKGSAGETFAKKVNSLSSNYKYTYELVDYCNVTKNIAWEIKNGVFSVTAGLAESSANPPEVANLKKEGGLLVGDTVTLGYDFTGTDDASITFIMSEDTDGALSLEKYFVGKSSIDLELTDSLKRKTLKMIVLPMDKTGDHGTAKKLEIGTVVPEYEISAKFDTVWSDTIKATVNYEFNKGTKNLLAVLCQYDSSNKMIKVTYNTAAPVVGTPDKLTVSEAADADAVNAKLYLWEGTDLVNTTMVSVVDFVELNK